MDPSTPPFPGAQHNPMLTISMPAKPLVAPDGDILKASDAVNFPAGDPPEPVTLKPGHTLYRVFGGNAGEIGGYWSPAAPTAVTTEAEWRNTNAVLPSWNSGAFVAELTVNDGHTLDAWVGGIWSQAAKINKQIVPGWFLVGGGTQYHCDTWAPTFKAAVTVRKLCDTPWSTAGTTPAPAAEVAFAATPADLNPARPDHAHIAEAVHLANALRATARGLTSGHAGAANRMAAAANEVMEDANTMVAHAGTNDALMAHAVRGHLGLTRAIDIDPAWPNAQAAHAQLHSVVMSAARMSGVPH
ncbi:MAG: hypothetical protein AAFY49_01895 [Pseudomonadota bacterium]